MMNKNYFLYKYIIGLGPRWTSSDDNLQIRSPDGKYNLSNSFDYTIHLEDCSTGKEIKILHGHTNRITCLAFAQNTDPYDKLERYIISASKDKTIRIWSIKTGKELFSFIVEEEIVSLSTSINSYDFNLACVTADHSIIIFSLLSKKRIMYDSRFTDSYKEFVISPDLSYFLDFGSHDMVSIRKLISGDFVNGYRIKGTPKAFHKDGSKFICIGSICRVYDIFEGLNGLDEKNDFAEYESISREDVVITPYYFVYKKDATETELKNDCFEYDLGPATNTCNVYQVSQNFNWLVLDTDFRSSDKIQIRNLYDSSSSTIEWINLDFAEEFQISELTIISISNDGVHGIIANKFYDTESIGYVIAHINFQTSMTKTLCIHDYYKGEYYGHFSADGKLVAINYDETFEIWDIENYILRKSIQLKNESINAFNINQSGEYLICAISSGSIQVWDIYEGKLIKTITNIIDEVVGISINSDMSFALTSDKNNVIKLWDLLTLQQVKLYEINEYINKLTFTEDSLYCICTSNRWSATSSNKIFFLNLETGKIDAIIPLFIDQTDKLYYDDNGCFYGKMETIDKIVSFVNELNVLQPNKSPELMGHFFRPDKFEFLQKYIKPIPF